MNAYHKRDLRLLGSLAVVTLSLSFALALPGAASSLARPAAVPTDAAPFLSQSAETTDAGAPGPSARVEDVSGPHSSADITPTQDMNVVKNFYSGKAEAGKQFIYQINFTNQGNAPASNVIVTDTLPAGVTFVSVPYCSISPTLNGNQLVWNVGRVTQGNSGFLYAQVQITDTAQVGSVLTNVVRVSTSDVDIDPTDDVYTLTTTLTTTTIVAPGRDMKVTQSLYGAAIPGQEVQYNIRYNNLGSLTATNVIITDMLPISVTYVSHSASGFSTVVTGSMLVLTRSEVVGDSGGGISITVRVTDTAPVGAVITNVTQISTGDVDVNLTNNAYTLTTSIVASTRNLQVFKSVAGGAPQAGSPITYQIYFYNQGNYTATNVILTDTLPASATFIAWSGYANPTITPTVVGNQVVWNLGQVTGGGSGYIYPVVIVTDTAPTGARLVNQASISTHDAETNYSDNTSVITMTVVPYGGPDAGAYTFKDNTLPDGPSFNWLDATDGFKSYVAGNDRFDGPISIGFNFYLYGSTFTQTYLSTNGLMTFGRGSTEPFNKNIPDPLAPNNMLAAFWDDLQVCGSQAIYYKQGGTVPNRYLVAEWSNVKAEVPMGSNPAYPITFETVIYENGTILFQYQSLTGTLYYSASVEIANYSASVGIENGAGEIGLQYSFNEARLANGRAILFSPNLKFVFLPVVLKD